MEDRVLKTEFLTLNIELFCFAKGSLDSVVKFGLCKSVLGIVYRLWSSTIYIFIWGTYNTYVVHICVLASVELGNTRSYGILMCGEYSCIWKVTARDHHFMVEKCCIK